MSRTIALLSLCAVVAASASARAEDPKFAQLKTKDLISTTAPDFKGGIVFPGGALDLSANPIGMILANFEAPIGARFVRVKMVYKGEYTDPNTKIAGHLYHLKDESYNRYFFVSANGIQGADSAERYVIDYNDQGAPLAYFRGKFAARP